MLGDIDVAGHIKRRRGLNDIVIVTGSTLCTSSRIATPGSSSGANTISLAVNAACAYVNVVASGRTAIDDRMFDPSIWTGYPSSLKVNESPSRTSSGYVHTSAARFS